MKKIVTVRQKIELQDILAKICYNYLNTRSSAILAKRGGKMAVFANDYVSLGVITEGFYELFELQSVFEFLAPLREFFSRSIAIDVGANIGNHSIFLSRYFSLVHAFEPHPLTRQILEINASIYPHIVVHGFGLNDIPGTYPFVENPTNMGGSHIGKSDDSNLEFEFQRLDDQIIERDKIALIKLDVEGCEANVLRGGIETLKQATPIVLFETHLEDFKGPMEEVDILSLLGYRFAWIQPIVSGVQKYLKWITMLITKRKTRHIYTGDKIQPANHAMVIGIPPRWLNLLGLT